jgi:hypothetical protein
MPSGPSDTTTRMDERENRYQVAGMSEPPAPTNAPEPSSSLTRAIAAGLVAAIAGGVAWALIVKASDYEVGFVAWGIGFLVGTAIVFATRGAKGRPLQIVAVVLALVGILLGKYLTYALIVQEDIEAFGESIGLFSADMFEFFRDDLDAVFSFFDLLWVGLAVASAWRIPQADEPEPAPPREPAPPPQTD